MQGSNLAAANEQNIEDWYIGFVPGTLNPMNLVRIQNPQPLLSLSVSLNTTELRDKVMESIRFDSVLNKAFASEIGSVTWLDC